MPNIILVQEILLYHVFRFDVEVLGCDYVWGLSYLLHDEGLWAGEWMYVTPMRSHINWRAEASNESSGNLGQLLG
jgi:hypothetical protein